MVLVNIRCAPHVVHVEIGGGGMGFDKIAKLHREKLGGQKWHPMYFFLVNFKKKPQTFLPPIFLKPSSINYTPPIIAPHG